MLSKRSLTRAVRRFVWHRNNCFPGPVLVYQMGKVASASVYKSLRATKCLDVSHVHSLIPNTIAAERERRLCCGLPPLKNRNELFLYHNVITPRRTPTRIISLVREPIGRDISAFFQNFQVTTQMKYGDEFPASEQLIDDFLRLAVGDSTLSWFDNELLATTGVDIYQHNFPKERGYQVVDDPIHRVLVMRHDLDDALKERCIGDFLGLRSFRVSRRNESSSKVYAKAYKEFVKSIEVPSDYAERMLCSKYAQHFYSEQELDSVYRWWTDSNARRERPLQAPGNKTVA